MQDKFVLGASPQQDLAMFVGRGACGTMYGGKTRKACETGFIAGYAGRTPAQQLCDTVYYSPCDKHACMLGYTIAQQQK